MANNCITCFKFFGDKEEISQFYEKLTKLDEINDDYHHRFCKAKREANPLPNYPPEITQTTPDLWLGDIVTYFGGDNKNAECGGVLDYYDLHTDTIIWLVADTAWHPMPEMWNMVIKDYPSIKFHYLSEEKGNQIYINSDPTGEYFDQLYAIDNDGYNIYAPDDERLFSTIASLIEVKKITTFEELDRLLEEYNERHEGAEIHYYKFTKPN